MVTETITYEDTTTGETHDYTVEKWIECEHCGNVWQSGSDLPRPSCSRCSRRTDRQYVYRYSFFSKQTCWLEERIAVEDLYEAVEELFQDTEHLEWELYFDQYGKLVASTEDTEYSVPVEMFSNHMQVDEERLNQTAPSDTESILDGLHSPDGEGLPTLDRSSLTPIEEVERSSTHWPTRAPLTVEPYAESMRRYARRLELLVENGWELVESNGEYIYFEKDTIENRSDFEVTDELT